MRPLMSLFKVLIEEVFSQTHMSSLSGAGLPEPTVRITLSSSAGSGTQECLGVDFGSQQANEISCLAGVTNSLLNPHTVTLMGGGLVGTSKLGQNISLQLSSGPRTFTCSVCINIEEAKILDYCSSDDVTISGDGE